VRGRQNVPTPLKDSLKFFEIIVGGAAVIAVGHRDTRSGINRVLEAEVPPAGHPTVRG
jgi:hypothetical protein